MMESSKGSFRGSYEIVIPDCFHDGKSLNNRAKPIFARKGILVVVLRHAAGCCAPKYLLKSSCLFSPFKKSTSRMQHESCRSCFMHNFRWRGPNPLFFFQKVMSSMIHLWCLWHLNNFLFVFFNFSPSHSTAKFYARRNKKDFSTCSQKIEAESECVGGIYDCHFQVSLERTGGGGAVEPYKVLNIGFLTKRSIPVGSTERLPKFFDQNQKQAFQTFPCKMIFPKGGVEHLGFLQKQTQQQLYEIIGKMWVCCFAHPALVGENSCQSATPACLRCYDSHLEYFALAMATQRRVEGLFFFLQLILCFFLLLSSQTMPNFMVPSQDATIPNWLFD